MMNLQQNAQSRASLDLVDNTKPVSLQAVHAAWCATMSMLYQSGWWEIPNFSAGKNALRVDVHVTMRSNSFHVVISRTSKCCKPEGGRLGGVQTCAETIHNEPEAWIIKFQQKKRNQLNTVFSWVIQKHTNCSHNIATFASGSLQIYYRTLCKKKTYTINIYIYNIYIYIYLFIYMFVGTFMCVCQNIQSSGRPQFVICRLMRGICLYCPY